ncbi:MAG: hypothetical protein MZU95_08220 [Desulfomicrobium escambiense]|nr:hypothetical protein [Desulfomicrobium escambiense]
MYRTPMATTSSSTRASTIPRKTSAANASPSSSTRAASTLSRTPSRRGNKNVEGNTLTVVTPQDESYSFPRSS